jgi:hypothetical protein
VLKKLHGDAGIYTGPLPMRRLHKAAAYVRINMNKKALSLDYNTWLLLEILIHDRCHRACVPEANLYEKPSQAVFFCGMIPRRLLKFRGRSSTSSHGEIMATAGYINSVQEIFIAYYGRPADPAGLNYWVGRLTAVNGNLDAIIDAFANSPEAYSLYGPINDVTIGNVIDSIYMSLFNRLPDAGGKAYYMAGYANGTFTAGTIALNILDGAQGEDQIVINNKLDVANRFTTELDTAVEIQAYAGDIAAGIARDMLSEVAVSTNPLTFYGVDGAIAQIVGGGVTHVFTLTEAMLSATTADITTTIDPVITTKVYWGFNPHAHGETGVDNLAGPNTNNLTNEGPADGGVPLEVLINYLQTLAGLNFYELGLIDTNDIVNDLQGITINNNNDDGTQTISITLPDGTVNTAEVALGEMYFKLLHDALFDAEGNSRLFEKEFKTWPQVILKDQNGDPVLDADGVPIRINLYQYTANGITVTSYIPIVLTPFINNGGTVELGFPPTTAGDDLIVAGRLELLHGAYIDAGGGYNTLEVDAKGTFAQPLQLLNIQEVHVQNLPNVYTTGESGDGDGYLNNSTYPQLSGDGATYSVLDLSRAVDLERLVINESDYGSGLGVELGALTVAGVRNGAVVRFEGGFTQDVTVHYGEGRSNTEPLTVELVIGQIAANLNFVHDTDSLHLVSLGGGANSFGAEDINGSRSVLGGNLTTLEISGNASLYINGDLDDSFQDATPVTIDSSRNSGGVNLTLSGSQNVTFIGSMGDDRFDVTTADRDGGPTNDESVTIVGGVGNNYYEVSGAEVVTITNADGNNNYEIDNASGQPGFRLPAVNLVTITTGNGNNTFELSGVATAVLTAGNGANRFEVYSDNSADYSSPDDSVDFESDITIKAGNGKNDINVEANYDIGIVNVTVGSGGNEIDAVAHAVTITSGTGPDVIKVLADVIKINSGGGGDTITIGGFDYDYVGTDVLGGNGSDGGSGDWGDDGALVQVNTGTGPATVIIGSDEDYQYDADNDFPGVSSLTAHEGSFITGGAITLFVKTVADLRAATLTNVTSVILDDDAFDSCRCAHRQ